MTAHVLLVEDEVSQRELVKEFLEVEGYKVTDVGTVEDALAVLNSETIDVVFSDWKLEQRTGMELLEYTRKHLPELGFVIATAYGTIAHAVEAMKNGGVTLNSAYLRPRSRGTVRLASADPKAAPLIDPNYWADPHDRDMAIRGLKLARDIMSQDALKPFIKAERLPGPDVQSDADYFDYACAHAKTDHHPAGTCRMGIDSEAVVDPELCFKGISNLRIVDNSIMPQLISSNTNATAMMIGEKAADMIKKTHSLA